MLIWKKWTYSLIILYQTMVCLIQEGHFLLPRKITSSQSKYNVTNFAEVKRQFLDAVVETIEMEEACMSLTDTELGPYGYLDSSIFYLDHG